MKKYLLLAALASAAGPSVSTAAISSYDQYILELINRARANPTAEADRLLSGNLNEGLAANTISLSAKQPLAFDLNLDAAAEGHSNDMINNDFFAHTSPTDSSTPSSRVTAAGYSWNAVAENLAARTTIGLSETDAENLHNNLFQDFSVVGRGHRLNLMNETYESIGISYLHTNSWGPFSGMASSLVTQNFGSINDGISYITGVAYNDSNSNNFFTPGEEFTDVTVEAFLAGTSTSAGTATTATFGSGGYSLGLGDGTYDLVFSGSLGELRYDGVTVSGSNLKLDYTNSTVTAVPLPASVFLLLGGLVPFGLWRRKNAQ